jgi:protein-S-isoprenylcysteine O-methyltransferase Ste14
VNVLGVIPYFLFKIFGIQSIGLITLAFGNWRYIIVLLFLFPGLFLFVSSINLFKMHGKGTLAPWTPTKYLVIKGPYGYLRNPMISGVVCLLLAESFFFQSAYIFLWAVSFFLINHIYFIFFEERILGKKFGENYLEYKKNVPRWLPKRKRWIKPS